MRLLRTTNLDLVEFIGSCIPRYAILSHTWGNGEVTFRDMTERRQSLTTSLEGYRKITKACRQAIKDGYDYLWIDTCCIDKTSSAELTEAINSMYEWYSSAEICYAFLSDVSPYDRSTDSLIKSRWFTRGWTLQELLAPSRVEFYDSLWKFRGSKDELATEIAARTGIPHEVLLGQTSVRDCSIAMKMSWAAGRETTRDEDASYCLLGLFEINMALLYGEGQNAFRRLQEEIVKRTTDLTIFAWQSTHQPRELIYSVLAPSIDLFSSNFSIVSFANYIIDVSITNKGIKISGESRLHIISGEESNYHESSRAYLFMLGLTGDDFNELAGIYVRKIGPQIFCRDTNLPIAIIGRNSTARLIRDFHIKDYYILNDMVSVQQNLQRGHREGALFLPRDSDWILIHKCPELLWDEADRVFLNAITYDAGRPSMLLFAQFDAKIAGTTLSVIAVCQWDVNYYYSKRQKKGSVGLFIADAMMSRIESLVFHSRLQYDGVTFDDLVVRGLELPPLKSSITTRVGLHEVQITASITQRPHLLGYPANYLELHHKVRN